MWQPSERDYQQIFAEQNPWHRSGEVPAAWALPVIRPLARHLWSRVLRNLPRRYELVLGPRRVGKTTSMYQTARRLMAEGVSPRRIWWLRLDHPLLMNIDLGSLVSLVATSSQATVELPTFIFMDELTYAKDWDLWLKTFYDENRPLTVIGSSSSTAALRQSRIESGIGRWEEQYLAPYLFGEFLELFEQNVEVNAAEHLGETIRALQYELDPAIQLSDLRRRFLLTGGFPELLIAARDSQDDEASLLLESQRTLRSDAVERAIYKDLPQAFAIDNPMLMERLLYTLAGHIGGILSTTNIAQSLPNVSVPTIERYITYLERAFLVFTLPNYSGNESAKQRRGRKLYFVDGAVRNAALQRGLAPLSDTAEMGLLIENLAASHLHALGQLAQIRVYHWRHKDDEVDLIFDHPEFPMAFEIGMSPRHGTGGLRRLIEAHPRFSGKCYLVAPELHFSDANTSSDGIGYLPLDWFLLAVSAQAESALRQRLGAPA